MPSNRYSVRNRSGYSEKLRKTRRGAVRNGPAKAAGFLSAIKESSSTLDHLGSYLRARCATLLSARIFAEKRISTFANCAPHTWTIAFARASDLIRIRKVQFFDEASGTNEGRYDWWRITSAKRAIELHF